MHCAPGYDWRDHPNDHERDGNATAQGCRLQCGQRFSTACQPEGGHWRLACHLQWHLVEATDNAACGLSQAIQHHNLRAVGASSLVGGLPVGGDGTTKESAKPQRGSAEL